MPEEAEGHEYAFDVKLFAVVRVRAKDEQTARDLIQNNVDGMDLSAGNIYGDGWSLTLTEASADGEPDLFEIDGEDPEE